MCIMYIGAGRDVYSGLCEVFRFNRPNSKSVIYQCY